MDVRQGCAVEIERDEYDVLDAPACGSGLAAFVVKNTGPSRVTISKSKPPAGGAFSVVNDIPEGTTVAPGASITVPVSFVPGAVATSTGTFSVTANGDGTTITFP